MDSKFAEKPNQIIGKVRTKYEVHNQKFGVKIHKYVAVVQSFDEDNGNTLWWGSI